MRFQNPFAALSPSGLDSQVLTVLARSSQFLTINQIHQLLPEAGSLAGVRHPIARLVEQGTVVERKTGRTSGYALNREHLLIEPILMIASAKETFIERVREEINSWAVPPITVQLFGSAARDCMSSESDIDIFFVFRNTMPVDIVEDHVEQISQRMFDWTGNDVRPLVYQDSEISPAPIFDSIVAEGINLYGDPGWLRRTLQQSRQPS